MSIIAGLAYMFVIFTDIIIFRTRPGMYKTAQLLPCVFFQPCSSFKTNLILKELTLIHGIFLYFFWDYTQQEIGEVYGCCRSTAGIRIFCPMKRLSGRPTESQKPWTRFYGITASISESPPLKTDILAEIQRTA